MEVSSHGPEQVSFEQLFTQHAPFAWRVLRRFGVAESDLPDACQDAFIVVHRKLGEFEGRSNLRTWLYRICARVASDYRKRAHRRYEVYEIEPLANEPAIARDQQVTTELSQICALVENALDGLDDDKRQVFVLYELEDVPMTEIAALMACPIKTAFSRLYVARERVNAALRRAGCAALIVALDPLPLRQTAHAQLVSALKATGGAELAAVPLSAAQIVSLASTYAAQPVFTTPLLFTGGALAVAAALVLSLSNANVPTTPTHRSDARISHAPSHAEQTRVHVPEITAEAAPTSVEAPMLRRAPKRPRRAITTGATPLPATVQPQRDAATAAQWIEAPPSAQQSPVVEVATPGTGLDEVLSATSIRSLMRVGPHAAHRSDNARGEQWALLPDAPHTGHQR